MKQLVYLSCVIVLMLPGQVLASAIIGVSGQAPGSPSVTHTMASLRMMGLTPVLLEHDVNRLEEALSKVDGIVITGNSKDIHPSRYGKPLHPKTKLETNLDRATYEYALVEAVLERNIPFLGICGGMQRLNVSPADPKMRGTLHQHYPDLVEDAHISYDHGNPPHTPVEYLTVEPDTLLHNIADTTRWKDNSYHHQAVDVVRAGFRTSAINGHGIIEAIEPLENGQYADHPFALGVQWHPEYGASPISSKLFDAFRAAAEDYAASR